MNERKVMNYFGDKVYSIKKREVLKFGLEGAAFLNYLISEFNKPTMDYFHIPTESINEDTKISVKNQAKFIKTFLKLGILETPPDRLGLYRINIQKLIETTQ